MNTPIRWYERITIDPEAPAGKPVVCGAGPAVELSSSSPAQGWNEAEIPANYP
jgi:uncharacterized protein (DUF433 family)